jgi:hypothetical protein
VAGCILLRLVRQLLPFAQISERSTVVNRLKALVDRRCRSGSEGLARTEAVEKLHKWCDTLNGSSAQLRTEEGTVKVQNRMPPAWRLSLIYKHSANQVSVVIFTAFGDQIPFEPEVEIVALLVWLSVIRDGVAAGQNRDMWTFADDRFYP